MLYIWFYDGRWYIAIVFQENKVTKSKSKAICLETTKVPLHVGDMCFAKVRGYCEWPALVIGVENMATEVKFFNSGLTWVRFICSQIFHSDHSFKLFWIFSATCGPTKIYDVNEGLRFLVENKCAGFKKAVREMALTMKKSVGEEKSNNIVERYKNAYS